MRDRTQIKKFEIYNPYSNNTVTDSYVTTIEEALHLSGFETVRVSNLTRQKKKDTGVLTVAVMDAVRAKRKRYSFIILWSQGIIPEESLMRNNSALRFSVLSQIEKKGLKSADFVFMVSESMKTHYEKKYRLKLPSVYIMPCFNSEIEKDAFFYPDKYTNNRFLYAGGMQTWQCFEQTVQLYKKIELACNNSFFRVLTDSQEDAEKVLKKYDVQRYSIGFVPANEIGEEMKKAKFGFSLREDFTVNRVATPTKLSTYVSYGVIPIYSDYLEGFSAVAKHSPYCLSVRTGVDDEKQILNMCEKEIIPEQIYASFSDTFESYFSKEKHIRQINSMLKELIK